MRIQNFLLFLFISVLSINYVDAQNVGDAAPDFTLETLDGPDFTLSNQEGKVVFIFFFGYACPHCLSNGPNTQTGIYEVYLENEEFVAIGIDTWDGNKSGVENYKAATGIAYTLCLMGSELEQTYKTTYDRIVVVDKDGIIRYKATANATSGIVSEASAVIETYLNMEAMDDDDMMMGEVITSINEDSDQPGINLYPIPAVSELIIESSLKINDDFEIRILDKSGRNLYEKNFRNLSKRNSIPVDELDNGLYFLQILSSNQVLTRKFLVQK